MEADLSRLADEDDFSKNLKFFWDCDLMADVTPVMELEKGLVIEFAHDEMKTMRSVCDIVEVVCKKVRESPPTDEVETAVDKKRD